MAPINKAEAGEIAVSPGWATLRLAMLGAASGDTLLLASGTYSDDGGVVIKGGVTVRSSAGPATTIVALEKGTDVGVFLISNASPPPRLEGLTITHGSLHNGYPGGGITVFNSSPVIENNLILGNVNGDIEGNGGVGCGIGVEGGAPIIRNNTIVRNSCAAGAIDLYQTSAIVDHNVIAENRSGLTGGQGISCDASPSAIIQHNLFWQNGVDIAATCVQAADQDNIVTDPQFCQPIPHPMDPLPGDWRVLMTSPIAPGGPQSGWGADLGICPGTSPALQRSWGQIKNHYR